mgnify:CR=1 FL=1
MKHLNTFIIINALMLGLTVSVQAQDDTSKPIECVRGQYLLRNRPVDALN